MVDKITLRRYLSLCGIYAKMDLAWLLRDAKYALFAIFADTISNISTIAGIFLLAWRFDGLGGMGKYEVLFMLAYSNIMWGVLMMSGGCNALYISRIIGRGQWEHMFIMPLPYGVQLTIGLFPFTCSSTLISGVIIMCVAVTNLGITLPLWWILSLILNIIMSIIIVISFSYLASSFAFYAPVQCEEISSYALDSISHTGKFPLSGMPLYLQLPLLTLFPSGLLAWFPTMTLLGKQPLGLTAAFPVVVAIVLAFTAAYFFRKGFRYYVKKGINRYSNGGHRS